MLSFEKSVRGFWGLSGPGQSLRGTDHQPGDYGGGLGELNNNWVTSQLCPTPKKLLDVLRPSYEEYQGFLLTDGYKRD